MDISYKINFSQKTNPVKKSFDRHPIKKLVSYLYLYKHPVLHYKEQNLHNHFKNLKSTFFYEKNKIININIIL